MLRSADEVILLDCVQFTKRDWRNRNRIKTPQGTAWLTIPVEVKGRYAQAIDETRIADPAWADAHIRSIDLAYARAAHYEAVSPWLFDLLRAAAQEPLLTNVNERLLREICRRLQITMPILRCTDVIDRSSLTAMAPTERLIALAKARGATRYLTGPAARAYLDVDLFFTAGIDVAWMNYGGYADYLQLWGEFKPAVSIVDLLLNTGDEAPRYLARITT
jgi:WbqC-like protein family